MILTHLFSFPLINNTLFASSLTELKWRMEDVGGENERVGWGLQRERERERERAPDRQESRQSEPQSHDAQSAAVQSSFITIESMILHY